MTKNEIHLALAGIDGWCVAINPNYAGDAKWHCVKREGGEWVKCPNYDSLDVLHEMEKKLTADQMLRYSSLLLFASHNRSTELTVKEWRYLWCADAVVRQEALLRVHNQWKD